ncbi:MAG TPA: DUF805 domain-containing protein, partial [Candidatus Saccharimonadales bacterium]|nr:DUF805 domain-containing protein [Candidatus Saccharimonadales bacterium]
EAGLGGLGRFLKVRGRISRKQFAWFLPIYFLLLLPLLVLTALFASPVFLVITDILSNWNSWINDSADEAVCAAAGLVTNHIFCEGSVPDAVKILLALAVVSVLSVALCGGLVRRLHDQNWSGWWLIAYLLLPTCFVAWAMSLPLDGTDWHHTVYKVVLFAMPAVAILLLVQTVAVPGTRGTNRFGDDPRSAVPDFVRSREAGANGDEDTVFSKGRGEQAGSINRPGRSILRTIGICVAAVALLAVGVFVGSRGYFNGLKDRFFESAASRDCHALAGSIYEPDSGGIGTSFEKIKREPAVAACREAVQQNPQSAQNNFRFARALWATGHPNEALEYTRTAARLEYAPGKALLADLYYDGKAVPRDLRQSFALTRDAADQGYLPAVDDLGQDYDFGTGVPIDHEQAVAMYRKAAEMGYPDAQTHLGNAYYAGQGTPQDYKQVALWYRKAADQGNSVAQGNLGYMFEHGVGVATDYSQALVWLNRAAVQGEPYSESNLGDAYLYGWGTTADAAKAAGLYHQAAEKGLAYAAAALAKLYQSGNGVPQNQTQAAKWFESAARGGDAASQDQIGHMYHDGTGVAVDEIQSFYWYWKAAEQGNADAEVNVGYAYETGRGVVASPDLAFSWYKKAAEQGNNVGEFDLGAAYESGRGTPRDYEQAKVWFRKAAADGYPDATTALQNLENWENTSARASAARPAYAPRRNSNGGDPLAGAFDESCQTVRGMYGSHYVCQYNNPIVNELMGHNGW